MELHTEYQTSIKASVSGAETRRLLTGPLRVYRSRLNAEQARVPELKSAALRRAESGSLCVVGCDVVPVSSALSASNTVLPCDPSYRRFFVGRRALLFSLGGTSASSFEVVEIASVDPSGITVSPGITGNYDTAALVPVIESQVSLRQSGKVITDRLLSLNLEALEKEAPTSLPALVEPSSVPSGVSSYAGVPIFDLGAQWADGFDWSAVRQGTIDGRASTPVLFGSRAELSFSMPFEGDRISSWALIEFFDSRGGQTYPFWLVSPTTDYEFVSVGSSTLTIKQVGEENDWSRRPYVAVRTTSGAVLIRAVSSVSRAAGNDVLTLESDLGLSSSEISLVTACYFVRFDQANLVERWVSLGVMRTKLKFKELSREANVVLPALLFPDIQEGSFSWSAGDCSQTVYRLDPCPSQDPEAVTLWSTSAALEGKENKVVKLAPNDYCYLVLSKPAPDVTLTDVTILETHDFCECCTGVVDVELPEAGTPYFRDTWPWNRHPPDFGQAAASFDQPETWGVGEGFYTMTLNRMGPQTTKLSYGELIPPSLPAGATVTGFRLSFEADIRPRSFEGAGIMLGLFFSEGGFSDPSEFFGMINQNIWPLENGRFEATWRKSVSPSTGFYMESWDGSLSEDDAFPNTGDTAWGAFIDDDVFKHVGSRRVGIVAMCSGGQGLSNDGNAVNALSVKVQYLIECPP